MNNAAATHILRADPGKIVKVVLTMGVSVGLIVWMFHKIDFNKVLDIMEHGVSYWGLAGMMLTTTLSHIIRGIRWGIQLRAAGVPRMSVVAESVSIFGAYALNLLFPFLGEGWRCIYVARRQRVKLDTVIGTDLGDRASDGIMIGLFIILGAIVARPAIDRFMDHYRVGDELRETFGHPEVYVIALSVLGLLVLLDYAFRHTSSVQSINAGLRRTWQGFAVLFTMRGRWAYLWLTLGIWFCYYLNTYLCFFSFDFTRELIHQPGQCMGLVAGLVVFIFGSCSMIVPSDGGLGPWNIAVMFALTLYGVGYNDAAAYALMCWTAQTLIIVVFGIFSAIYILTYRRSHPLPPVPASEPQA